MVASFRCLNITTTGMSGTGNRGCCGLEGAWLSVERERLDCAFEFKPLPTPQVDDFLRFHGWNEASNLDATCGESGRVALRIT